MGEEEALFAASCCRNDVSRLYLFFVMFCFVSGVKVNLPKAKGTTPMVKLTPSTGWGAKRQNGSATTPLHGPEIIATTPSQALVLVAPLVLVVTRSTSSNSTSSSKAYTSTYLGSTNCSHILVPGQTSSLHGIGRETVVSGPSPD